jgi:general secretion pathway protein A
MYASHFGLEREPFSIAPDPRYLFMSERHREALAHLLYGVGGGGGFVLLTGEIGAGKTTVCRLFLEQVPSHCDVAYIFNPKLTVAELLQTVCEEFKVAVAARAGSAPTLKDHVDALNRFLLQGHAAGRSSVLIIDEAQNLASEVLEQLRLLTNLETHERKLLQIVLIGQPELRAMLARPDLEQLAQRVVARYHLEALSQAETLQYIEHRLTVAGLKGSLPLDRAACRRVHHHARGVPRRINLLCDRALLGAYGERRDRVDRLLVDRAAAEVFGTSRPSGWRVAFAGRGPWFAALGGIGALAVVAGLVWLLLAQGIGVPTVPGRAPPAVPGAEVVPARPSAGPDARPEATAAAAPPAGRAAIVAAASGVDQAGSSVSPLEGTVRPLVAGAAAGVAGAASSGGLPPQRGAVPDGAVPLGLQAGAAATQATGLPDPGVLPWDADRDTPWLFTREGDALRALARLWGDALQPGDACIAAARIHLQCHQAVPPLSLVRTLDRPGVVGLRGEAGAGRYALLVGLDAEGVDLALPAGQRRMSRAVFGAAWNGRFTTLWRSPLGYDPAQRALSGANALWLEARLREIEAMAADEDTPRGATAGAAAGAASVAKGGTSASPPWTARDLRAHLQAFQRAQGLEADGRLGALSFMQINRATRVDEPRLALRDARPSGLASPSGAPGPRAARGSVR